MRHLPIRIRLFSILVIFLIPVGVLTHYLLLKLAEDIDYSTQEAKGVQYEKPVLKLVDEVTDYQLAALSKSLGNAEAQKDLDEGAETISKLFAELEALDNEIGADLDLTPEGLAKHSSKEIMVADLKKKWDAAKNSTYDPKAYKALTDSFNGLIKHIGDSSGMILDPDLDSYYMVDLALGGIPQVLNKMAEVKIETYEDLRKNAGHISPAYLNNLVGDTASLEESLLPRIKDSMETTLHEDANFYGASPTLKNNLEPALAEYLKKQAEYIAMLHSLTNGEKVEPEKFLAVADSIHDGSAELGEKVLQELDGLIDLRLQNLKNIRFTSMAISGASLLVAFIVFFLVSNTIIRPVRSLQNSLSRIAQGDTDFEIQASTGKDELSLLQNATATLRGAVAEAYMLKQMVETMPASIMSVDVRDNLKVNYINRASLNTLKSVESYLPVKADQILGQSIDIFHKNPAHQRRLLADDKNLPHRARIKVGPESMQLEISPIYNGKREYVGAMLAWNIVTAEEKLAIDFETDVKSIVNLVAAAATQLSQTARNMSQTVSSSAQMAMDATSAATQTSSNVQTVASSAEELSASVREISSQLQKTNQLVQQSSQKAQNADQLASTLSGATQKVNEVMSMISSIAGQINLLALNATIESARAGEAGKGFAVVASEVKNLAGQTDKSIAEIQQVIEEMQSASDAIIRALGDIKGSVTDITGATTSVASAVEEQSAVTNEIARNMQTAAQGTQLISDRLGNVSAQSSQAGTAAEQMLMASQELSKQAEMLNNQVDAFLGRIRAA